MEKQLVERTQEVGVEVSVPEEFNNMVPLNHQAAFTNLSENEQKEIKAFADSIDVRKIENVMYYGAEPLKKTFDQCGKFLKDERGSTADQKVLAQVIELSKKASDSDKEFNLAIKEANCIEKGLFKFLSNRKQKLHTQKIQKKAITNYDVLVQLKNSSEKWLEMLRKAMEDIGHSVLDDMEAIEMLEKYLIAGYFAKERIEYEMEEIRCKHQETGLQRYDYEYEELKEGYEQFIRTLNNLEGSRLLYSISIEELRLTRRTNINIQTAIHTQLKNGLPSIAAKMRNAVLAAKNREVLEGQKTIVKLNDEFIKAVAQTVGITAVEAEKALGTGFYNIEATQEAVQTVITTCSEIQKINAAMIPKMNENTAKINKLIEQLNSCVTSVETLKIENPSSTGGGKLQF